ncbi:MAG: peptidase U32 [Clostridium sp. SCN 57-10]|nr:MAG: peptidase U32 [Clostridium sp. SCN 57-10]
MVSKVPELLAPAGDMEKLRFALAYGADAVYFAGESYGMRSGAGNFSQAGLREAVALTHVAGKRALVTVNTMPRGAELDALPAYLALLDEIGADGIIAADMGVIPLVKKYAPHAKLTISTQANVLNHGAANAYHALGADRIVLARELTLDEIAAIRAKTDPSLELEVFIHGSMCMAYSGRCMLSNALTGRDANRGACAQPCRWEYELVERQRRGVYIPVLEDERGTYIFNSKDLCMIDRLNDLLDIGLDSYKIEGRAKTFYYAAVVTGAYRRALDYAVAHPHAPLPADIAEEVHKVSHREYGYGFYDGRNDLQHREDSSYIRTYDVCAVVEQCDALGHATLSLRNKCAPGEQAELLSPDEGSTPFILEVFYTEEGDELAEASHPMMRFRTRLPRYAAPFSLIRKKNQEWIG